MMGLVPFEEKKHQCFLSLQCEDIVRRRPSAGQKEGLYKNQVYIDLELLSLQNYEKQIPVL